MSGKRECGQPARDKLVRVLAERDVLCVVADESSEARAHCFGLDGRSLPFVVDELSGIEPGALLCVEPDVRPRLVRVACEQKPLTDSKSRVVPREGILCQSSVSSPQSPVFGPQSTVLVTVDRGLRTVDRGLRTVDRGLRTVDRGPRTVDCGLLAELLSPSTQEAS